MTWVSKGRDWLKRLAPGVSNVHVGDRVGYFFAPGAYADRRLIDATALVTLPEDVSTLRAAALLAKGLTAWMAVKRAYIVRGEMIVYVTGATGGVGLLVARWAASLGATVIAGVGSQEKAQLAQAYGLTNVVVTTATDFAAQIQAITDGRKVDVVYEFVGRDTFEQSAQLIRAGGSLIHIGNASGAPVVDEAQLLAREVRYVKPSTPQYVGNPESLREASTELFLASSEGVFDALPITEYRLADVVRAHDDIAHRRHRGLSVLVP